ncbi:nucleotide-binding universal stress UspA family protein [Saccharopolyspora erythraea NRRL 2338]|uniref:Universal stress protein n=2 Tax=Saccharopolyspora erythraea TaxID=1836 RepID=A4FCE8_SACEN|nr:universal stress protein [Saccharopolyspora erythraea]EQD83899.1 universal stress protein [Saccharopolyspora erythraea D]PFG95486.1 nucleotide-binding universal stress UspA family protein [Saccharopolyspora erythraea NRRL 2338]QRK92115.1 universal stress protein [Saccharopolyspora erythraea]CAM01723.1 universal stress protein [Saccharopolyspora erythraea NRRL 2338]
MSNPGSKPVVAGVDGSSSAIHAVRWAAAEARRRNTYLRLVFADVFSMVFIPDMPAVALPEPYTTAVRRQAERWLEQAKDVAEAAMDGLAVRTEVHVGQAATVLIRQSLEAQLVVVGSRGLGALTGLIVGSVAVALSAHGHCPVAVIPGPETALPDAPAVVGVDGSSAGEKALTTAFESASRRGVVLRAVHTWHSVSGDKAWWTEGDWETAQTDEERWLAEQLAGWCAKYPEVEVRRYVSYDRPARALLEHAQHAQIVVVGARGRGGFTGLLLGSTSQQLLHHSPCPVVVAR